jgi:Flp pilus assembly protein TadD
VGLIKDLVIKIANENSVHGINFLENKKFSKSYFEGLSHNLLKKKHVNWSLSAIESAIQMDGKVAGFHRHKSGVLDRLGRAEEAMVTIKEAIKLEPNNPHHQHHLSNLLNKQ